MDISVRVKHYIATCYAVILLYVTLLGKKLLIYGI